MAHVYAARVLVPRMLERGILLGLGTDSMTTDMRQELRGSLLLHKHQLRRLAGKVREKGLTLVPLRVYFRGPYAKVELALARGKRAYDKRETVARRDRDRDMQRAIKERRGS